MTWTYYTARFGTTKPAFLPPISDPPAVAAAVSKGLDWMLPKISITPDTTEIRLSMNGASAEAALAHMRGSYKSVLFAAGVGSVGNWPLHLLAVEQGMPDDIPTIQAATDHEDSHVAG